MYYIKSDQRDWSETDFLASGEADVSEFVDPVLSDLGDQAAALVALDIGCGIGRLTRALAKRFAHVEAIDISREMIEQARKFSPPVPQNIRFQVCDGSGTIPLETATIGFIFSYIVFQHVPTLKIIERYFSEMSRVLFAGGLARVQVNTQHRPLKERFRLGIVHSEKMPLVKRKLKVKLEPHSTMGVVLTQPQCARLAKQSGMSLQESTGSRSQYTWLTLRRMR